MNDDWRKALVRLNTNIEQTIKVIDKGALRIALVVDDENILHGVVTDGDIRRALLNHVSLENPVKEIMNVNPRFASVSDSKTSILAILERDELLQIPILDNGVLVGLETLQHLLTRSRHDNPVFLMAGGFGTRLRPLTDTCPKPLLRVGEKPILENILESFIANGFWNFYISTHYMSEMVTDYFGDGSKWGVEIRYVKESEPLGTGGALGLLPQNIPTIPLIMMNGDLLTSVNFEDLLKFHKESRASLTMCVREYDFQVPYGVVEAEGMCVKSIVEKPVHKFFVNAGIYVLDSQVVKSIERNEYIDMPTLATRLISTKDKVAMFPIYEYWLDIGQRKDFDRAQIDIEGGLG